MPQSNLLLMRNKMKPLAATRGHQCPDCFSFNWEERLPENRKRQHQGSTLLTCALCRSEYPASRSQAEAA